MVRDRVRIRFRKAGDLRWTSHHDLLRCFERMLRRAALPFCSTEGFNPRPRLTFAQPLPLGIVGCNEPVDLELHVELPPEEIRARLAEQAPPGLTILSVERVAPRASLQPCRAVYRLALPAGRAEGLTRRAAEVLALSACPVERTRPAARTVDIRPFLADLRVASDALDIHLTVTPNGGARPNEVVRLLDLGDVLAAGAVLERTTLELEPEPANGGREPPGATSRPRLHPAPGGSRPPFAGTPVFSDSCPQEKDSHEERNAD